MNGYLVPMACPDCGGPLDHVNGTPGWRESHTVIVVCGPCRREWEVHVTIRACAKTWRRPPVHRVTVPS